MAPSKRTYVRIGSLNTAGKAAANPQEVQKLVRRVSLDILGLQEVRNLQPLHIPGYAWLPGLQPFERPKTHLGIGALVKQDLASRVIVADVN